ncbi:thiamine-phosphate kinase [Persephonella sp.]
MEIKKLGEFNLIDKLTGILRINDKDVVVGFGDDCSCVKINNELYLVTGDIQIENKHFIKEKISPRDLGWKLVSVNVSDVVSCGGIPKWGFISVGLPEKTELEYVLEVYRGIEEALNFYNFPIIGGNTSSNENIILDLFLIGKTEKFIGRDGAKIGEKVYLTGHTGLSKAGFELLLMGKEQYEDFEKRLILKHVRPKARIDVVSQILNFASSCIDISDGLSGDIYHISERSKVKIIIEKEKLPIHPDLKAFCEKYGKNVLDYVFNGGEDYELVLTSSKKLKNFYQIGYTAEGKGIFIKDGDKVSPLEVRGFKHL